MTASTITAPTSVETPLPVGVDARCTRCKQDLVFDGEYLTWGSGEAECTGTTLDHTVEPSAALPVETFLLSWTGGYDQPSFEAFLTLDEARAKGEGYAKDADESDTILVLKVTSSGLDRKVEVAHEVL